MRFNKRAVLSSIVYILVALLFFAILIRIVAGPLYPRAKAFMEYLGFEAGFEEGAEDKIKQLTEEDKEDMALDLFRDFFKRVEECNEKFGYPCKCSTIDFSELYDYYINLELNHDLGKLTFILKKEGENQLIASRYLYDTKIGIWSKPIELSESPLNISEFTPFIFPKKITKDFTPAIAYIGKYDHNQIGLGYVEFMKDKSYCGQLEEGDYILPNTGLNLDLDAPGAYHYVNKPSTYYPRGDYIVYVKNGQVEKFWAYDAGLEQWDYHGYTSTHFDGLFFYSRNELLKDNPIVSITVKNGKLLSYETG